MAMAEEPAAQEEGSVNTSGLVTAARRLIGLGYTVIASEGKKPRHRWKYADEGRTVMLDRDGANAMAMDAIVSGRANSVTVRFDHDLAALDLDFCTPGLTDIFIGVWQQETRADPVMVTGKKGGKIFIRMDDKDGLEPDEIIGQWDGPDGMRNVLELKRSLSAVYGQHPEGIRYRRYGGFAGLHETGPEELPVVDLATIRRAFRRALRLHSPLGTLDRTLRHVAMACAAAVLRGDISFGEMKDLMAGWGYADVHGLFSDGGEAMLQRLSGESLVQDWLEADEGTFAAQVNGLMPKAWILVRGSSAVDEITVFRAALLTQERHK